MPDNKTTKTILNKQKYALCIDMPMLREFAYLSTSEVKLLMVFAKIIFLEQKVGKGEIGSCKISLNELIKLSSLSKQTVIKSIRELVKTQWLYMQKINGETNTYCINTHRIWNNK